MRQSRTAEVLQSAREAAKNAKCLSFFKERSRGAVYEREEVSKDALPELQCRRRLVLLFFWCLEEIKLRARELI